MFIREIKKKNPNSPKIFTYHRLVESFRVQDKTRQRVVLDLGTLNLPRERWNDLANRIEELVISRGPRLVPLPEEIELLAVTYAQRIQRKRPIGCFFHGGATGVMVLSWRRLPGGGFDRGDVGEGLCGLRLWPRRAGVRRARAGRHTAPSHWHWRFRSGCKLSRWLWRHAAPEKSQFFRPTAKGRMAFSVRLLSGRRRPSLR